MSKHEGFCVPLLEAMHFDVPVIARAVAAVPETMDGAGVLVNELNFAEMAEMLDMLAQPGQFRDRIIEGQRARLQRYKATTFEEHLQRVLDLAIAAREEAGS
jgi:glycosyltransferase involved in cell wall biosynthesis